MQQKASSTWGGSVTASSAPRSSTRWSSFAWRVSSCRRASVITRAYAASATSAVRLIPAKVVIIRSVATLLAVLSGLTEALQHRPLVAVPLLFAAGLVTSTNPCIWPMIPITAGTLAGVNDGTQSRRRTIGLTLTYAMGLALFYAILGLIAGLSGSLFGAIGSSWWARLAIGNVLVVFGLAMLDVIPIRVPARLAAWAGSL